MEDNINIPENEEKTVEQVHQPRNTKEQTVLYTIISIVLFCVIYFGGKGILNLINRPYYMTQEPASLSDALHDMYYEYASVSKEQGLIYENSILEKSQSGYKLSILFSGIEEVDEFTENGILFEYGDAIENVANEFYPYINNMNYMENVIATKYVDNENPNNEMLIFEYEDKIYAEFQSYGVIVPTKVEILFDGCEKVF